MVEFILNDTFIRTVEPPGSSLLDFIRYEMDMKGTKVGCREGDCGACMVMEGSLADRAVKYQTIVSCLTPLGIAQGKHIVTVEGLNLEGLSPAQQAIVEQGGTQCGFCTPGFVISLTSFCLSENAANPDKALAAMDGNICRCTGYKSIERAAKDLAASFSGKDWENTLEQLVATGHLPEYFNGIAERLKTIEKKPEISKKPAILIAGGTDLLVQKADEMVKEDLAFLYGQKELKGIHIRNNICTIGAATVATEISSSAALQPYFPRLQSHFKLISSTPIRNVGTLGGNLVNASPIGDLSIFFLALDARLQLKSKRGEKRQIPLKEFFTGYKEIELQTGEIIEKLSFSLPGKNEFFNFEKVSKRRHLDIASVNTALRMRLENETIVEVGLSAGGIAPVPLYLSKTVNFLTGRKLTEETLHEANGVMQSEIAPISDIRGSETYKRLLLRQLFFAHFLVVKPDSIKLNKLLI